MSCRKGDLKGILLRLFLLLFVWNGAMKMTMDAQASASEIGVGLSQNLVGYDGSRLLPSVLGQGTDAHPLSSLLTTLQTNGSLGTFLPRFDTQAGGGLGAGGLGSGLPSQGSGPLGLRIIPLVTMSERYDSNIFFAPKIPGLDRQDWVTRVSPQVFLQDNGRIVGTTLNVGATSEYYAKNTGLSYIGYNAGGRINVTPLLRRFVPEASLFFAGRYSYTPLPPAFLGGGSEQTNPAVGEEITSQLTFADTFIRGTQAQRVNTTTYGGTIAGAVNYSPNLYFQAAYNYNVVNFGTPSVTQKVSTFKPLLSDTTAHSVSLGPTYAVTSFDSVNLRYQYETVAFDASGGGYQSHQATVGYQRLVDASMVARVYGGAALFTQDFGGQAGSTSADSSEQVTYTGGASLSWARRNTQASFSYSVGVYPSFVGVPGVILSNNVSLQVRQRLDDNVGVFASLNFADNNTIGGQAGQAGQAGLGFRSYSTTESLWYRISTSFFVNVTHEWGLYTGNFTGQQSDSFVRNAVTVSLTKAWN